MLETDTPVTRVEACSLSAVRRVAAMLDLEPDAFAEGAPLPRGWHFMLLGADTRRSELRGDGFPGLGVPMPDLGLPRLMLGGRSVTYQADIPIGATVRRTSVIKSLTQKKAAAGPMAVAKILHELQVADAARPAVVEEQTYLLLGPRQGVAVDGDAPASPAASDEHTSVVVPDETLLFQYSALGFNSHKIHIDRSYAREVELFPDLVVNGGLATLLLTEFLRRELAAVLSRVEVRHLAPLFCNRPITLAANRDGASWRLKALDDKNRLAVDMEVTVQ